MTFSNASGETIRIESDSMSHGPEPSKEALDYGDVVEIVKINSRNDIVTYVQGKERGYKKFGSYGDVIIYDKNGVTKDFLVTHRAVIWIEYNTSASNRDPFLKNYGTFDIPSMKLFNVTRFFINDYFPNDFNLSIDINVILRNFREYNVEPHSGFLTKGDNNIQCDQLSDLRDSRGKPIEPVKIEWIKGRAEKPWFQNIYILIVIILLAIIIIAIIILIIYFRSKKKKKKEYFERKDQYYQNIPQQKSIKKKKSPKVVSRKRKDSEVNGKIDWDDD